MAWKKTVRIVDHQHESELLERIVAAKEHVAILKKEPMEERKLEQKNKLEGFVCNYSLLFALLSGWYAYGAFQDGRNYLGIGLIALAIALLAAFIWSLPAPVEYKYPPVLTVQISTKAQIMDIDHLMKYYECEWGKASSDMVRLTLIPKTTAKYYHSKKRG